MTTVGGPVRNSDPTATGTALAAAATAVEDERPLDDPYADPRDAFFVAKQQGAGLGRRTAKSMAWTVGGQWAGFLVQMVGTFFLARLLSPRDYGLYGSVITVTAFADQFKTLGLSQAVIQRSSLSHRQVSGLFWVNVSIGAALTVLVAAMSPLVALFFGQPELMGMTALASLVYVITSFSIQHNAILMRNMRFKAVAVRSLLSSVVAAAVGVTAASFGAGYWSLALMPVTTATFGVLTSWTASRWRPSRPRRNTDINELLRFGSGLSIYNVLTYLSKYMDNILIGRFLGTVQLGLYTRAYGILLLPLQQINNPVGSVVQSSLSRLWHQPQRYRTFYMASLRGLSLVTVPLVVFFAVMANEVILVMLGPQWLDSADVFRLLAIGGIAQVIGYTNGWLYVTSGRTAAMAKWALYSRPTVVIGFIVGLPWGIKGVATGFAVTQVILAPIGFWSATRGTPVSVRDVWIAAWRSYVLAIVMGGALFPLRIALDGLEPAISLVICLVTAIVVVAVTILVWPGSRREVRGLLALRGGKQPVRPSDPGARTVGPTVPAQPVRPTEPVVVARPRELTRRSRALPPPTEPARGVKALTRPSRGPRTRRERGGTGDDTGE